MRFSELQKFIEEKELLKGVEAKPGIYSITIDDSVVYIGQSNNIRKRCEQHIYNTENAMLTEEKKYLLLLSAKLGGHNIDCKALEYVDEDQLLDREKHYIKFYSPILNINVYGKRQNIYSLKIEDVLEHIKPNTYKLALEAERYLVELETQEMLQQ